MTAPYTLTATAAAELQDITSYSYDRWGDRQASVYTAKLVVCMRALAAAHPGHKDILAFA